MSDCGFLVECGSPIIPVLIFLCVIGLCVILGIGYYLDWRKQKEIHKERKDYYGDLMK